MLMRVIRCLPRLGVCRKAGLGRRRVWKIGFHMQMQVSGSLESPEQELGWRPVLLLQRGKENSRFEELGWLFSALP